MALSVSSLGSWVVQHPPTIIDKNEQFHFLSVSSLGSWVVQHSPTRLRQSDDVVFQYPLWDRGWCNTEASCIRQPKKNCSIIFGSWVVQHAVWTSANVEAGHFQYPLWDRGWCNIVKVCCRQAVSHTTFSILFWDRGWCNNACRAMDDFCQGVLSVSSFGIVGGATSHRRHDSIGDVVLSVSYLGSWVVQLIRDVRLMPHPGIFQYPLSGSWVVQPFTDSS